MLENDFYNWLVNQKSQQEATAHSRKSNCLRVEQFEGDLDEHFARDKCSKLLDTLVYTSEDKNHNRPTRHKIPINGDKRTGTATLKQAVTLYVEFKMDREKKGISPLPPIGGENTGERGGTTPKKGRGRYKGNAIGNAQNLLIRNILSNLGNESFSEHDWENTKKYFDNKCAYCGSDDKLEMDHAIPINKEKLGEHKIGNIVPVCKDCNSRKAGTDYKEFLKNNTVALKKIEAYMHSKNYDPLGNSENNEQLKKILNMAHQEVAGVAKRYIEIVNDLFINGREEESY